MFARRAAKVRLRSIVSASVPRDKPGTRVVDVNINRRTHLPQHEKQEAPRFLLGNAALPSAHASHADIRQRSVRLSWAESLLLWILFSTRRYRFEVELLFVLVRVPRIDESRVGMESRDDLDAVGLSDRMNVQIPSQVDWTQGQHEQPPTGSQSVSATKWCLW